MHHLGMGGSLSKYSMLVYKHVGLARGASAALFLTSTTNTRQQTASNMLSLTILVNALGLLGLYTFASASPTDPEPPPEVDPVSCPFNGTVGPNLMLANVT